MAENERTTQNKQGDLDQKHSKRQKESQPSFDTLHAWDQGLIPLTETPFHPRMDEHAAILSSIPFSAQRHEFIMRLHQTYGNRYVQRLVESMKVQAKLTVSNPNDVYEQEADRVAEAVSRSINTAVQRQKQDEEEELQMQEEEEEVQTKPVLQRQEEGQALQMQPVEEEDVQAQRQEEEEEIQAKSAEGQPDTVSESVEARIKNARGSGHPLSDNVREPMEKAFEADFSDVHVHTDAEANLLSQELSARAFTTAKDMFFRDGEYSPGSDSGKKLIAHELTHVVQQGTGLVSRTKVRSGTQSAGVQYGNDMSKIAIQRYPLKPGIAWGLDEKKHAKDTVICFTNLDTCIGFVGKLPETAPLKEGLELTPLHTLVGIHLVKDDKGLGGKNEKLWEEEVKIMKDEIRTVFQGCSEVIAVGNLDIWSGKGDGNSALFQELCNDWNVESYMQKSGRVWVGPCRSDQDLKDCVKETPREPEAWTEPRKNPGLLSKIEQEVLRKVGENLGDEQIAQEIGLDKDTVVTHINNIYSKLGIHDRNQAKEQAKLL